MCTWGKRLLLATLTAGATAAGWITWHTRRDYGPVFLARKGQLVEVQRQRIAVTARTTTDELRLRSDTGLEALVRLRGPNCPGRFPGVLLAVGLHTGAQVLELIDECDDLVVAAVDYGWNEHFDVRSLRTLWSMLRRLGAVSMAAVPRQLLGLEALASDSAVDAERLSVVGVSYGAYIALPAAVLEPRVRRLILAQGGGEIGPTIAANAPHWEAAVPPRAAGRLAEALYAPFRPERWICRLSPRRVTFIASRQDVTLPAESVMRVYARAGEPKEFIWQDLPHVGPDAVRIIAALAEVVLAELRKPE